MKKVLLILISFIATNQGLSAREKEDAGPNFFLRCGLGFAFPQAGQNLDNNEIPYNGTINVLSSGDWAYNIKNASFSSGFHSEIGLGYMLNSHIGFELDLCVGLSTARYTGYINNITIDSIVSNYSQTQTAENPVLLVPSIVYKTGWIGSCNFYARGGLVLPLSTHVMQDQSYSNLPGAGSVETDVYTYDIKTKFIPGFKGAMGMELKINDANSFYAEMQLLSMSLYPSAASLTGLTVNGVAYTPGSAAQSAQNITYNNTVIVPNGNTNSSTQTSYALPFSNIGIHVGLVHTISYSTGGGRHRHSVVRRSW